MESKMFYFIQLDNEKRKDIERDSTYVFDTNVLLNLYRYSKSSRDILFKILESKTKLWLPYRVVEEFDKDRIGCILDEKLNYQKVKEDYQKFKTEICKKLRCLKENKELEEVDTVFKKVIDKVEIENSHEIDYKNDSILYRLVKLFENNVGDPYDEETLEKIRKESVERYKNKVPPGYKDCDKPKQNNEDIGDLIIWNEIIDFSKNNKENIVFVTNDNKEDWVYKKNGKIIGPRYELAKEFFKKTQHNFILKNIETLIYEENLEKKEKEKVVSETKNIRLNQDNCLSRLNNITSIGKLNIPDYSKVLNTNSIPITNIDKIVRNTSDILQMYNEIISKNQTVSKISENFDNSNDTSDSKK